MKRVLAFVGCPLAFAVLGYVSAAALVFAYSYDDVAPELYVRYLAQLPTCHPLNPEWHALCWTVK